MKRFVRNKVTRLYENVTKEQVGSIENIKARLEIIDQKIQKIDDTLAAHTPERTTTLHISENVALTKLFNGQKLYILLDDISVGPHVALDGIWEEDITKAWVRLAGKAKVVFDIGANYGYYGLIASQQMDMLNGQVHYFEPNHELVTLIKRTLALNWLVQGSRVVDKAVSDKSGSAKLNVLDGYVGSSSLHTMDHLGKYLSDSMYLKSEKTVNIQTVTIDEYCKDNAISAVDLIKLDVEGFEEKAYSGMRKTVSKSSELILFIEFTWRSYEDPKAYFERMKSDFAHVYTVDHDGRLQNIDTATYDEMIMGVEDWIMLVFSKRDVE